MDYAAFYDQLFRSIVERVGPIDHETIAAIIGFDAGGPVSLCSVGHGLHEFVTYVSCELAVRDDQLVGEEGPYELMTCCNDESWARTVLSGIARLGLEARLEPGHTVDIGPLVGESARLQGVVLDGFASVEIGRRPYRILIVHGVTRDELAVAKEQGVESLLLLRRRSGIYPRTCVR